MTQAAEELRTVPVLGQDIQVKKINDAQVLLMLREAQLIQKSTVETARRVKGVGHIFDIIESVVTRQEDKDFLLDKIITGEATVETLMPLVTAFMEDADAEEAPKPRVRRGRPPKRPA
jgi:hypothetical protein